MIAAPPVDVGAVHVKATCAFAAVPAKLVGAPGVPMGVTELEVVVLPLPAAFVALTLNK